MVNTVRNFSATTFNCHGIKSSLKYVLDQARNHDIVFVNEHWLQASDIHHITNICTDNAKWCYFKTSVDPNHELKGRPHGGLGFICAQSEGRNISYKVIETSSDRVLGLQVLINYQVVLSLIGLYLPTRDSSAEQMELYLETLDQAQAILDGSCSAAPTLILGALILSYLKRTC